MDLQERKLWLKEGRENGGADYGLEFGEKVGKWKIISQSESVKGRRYRFCECECGMKKLLLESRLANGGTYSCGCSRSYSRWWYIEKWDCPICSDNFGSYQARYSHFVDSHKPQIDNGKRLCCVCLNLCDISFFCKSQSACKKCQSDSYKVRNRGRSRFVNAKRYAKGRQREWSISDSKFLELTTLPCHYCGGKLPEYGVGLDRKDCSGGYEVDNVVPCCRRCNVVKNDFFSYEEMLVLSETIKKIDEDRR